MKVSGRLRLRLRGACHVGRDVVINSGWCNYVGVSQRASFWVARGATLVIGDGCGLSNCTIVCMQEIMIGDETLIGGGTAIYDTDFHQLDAAERASGSGPVRTAAVRIGRRCFIGGHSVILKGVSIGDEAVIGAGSVVTRDVPAGEVWGGAPARCIRTAIQKAAAHG